MQRLLRAIIPAAALVLASTAWAAPLYQDGNWGIVRQSDGSVCIVVLNSDNRKNAFHFLIDGEQNAGSIGILDQFLPTSANDAGSMMITLDLGPQFARPFEFKRQSDGAANSVSAALTPDDLDSIFAVLRSGDRGVTLTFETGETWRIPAPARQEAASAITECWNGALNGARIIAA